MVTPNTIRKIHRIRKKNRLRRMRQIRFKRKVMEKQEGYTYLETIGDLKNHIGEILHFSYMQSGHYVAYMKKLTRVSDTWIKAYDYESKIPDGFPIQGTNVVVLSSQILKNLPRLTSTLNQETMSNVYKHIRIPTEDEIKLYRNVLRHARIFGKEK